MIRGVRAVAPALALAAAAFGATAGLGQARAASPSDDWLEIDYAPLLDRRQISHSGEPVDVLLRRLGGRPLPAPGQRPGDRLAHSLLDPLVESYAFVLADALDSLNPVPETPLIEVGPLWRSGQAQPAWAELLRSRHFVVESDGAGTLRLFLPTLDDAGTAETGDSRQAARRAYRRAWPILRHLFAAERRRLGEGSEALEVRVHAYRHLAARSVFRLGARAHTARVEDTRPEGSRPPLDLAGLQAFLDSGLQLEGARLEPDGRLRLLGSRVERRPGILGRPLAMSDLAVAYRAVFHGGLAEPYMSLDRGSSPQTLAVNYGGRLRDTALGMVSLLCDIRFKTFSLGLDIVEGRDLRQQLRESLPEFKTHLERFAYDALSAQVTAQQTRLWFYPDRVDLTVAPQGDVLAMRHVRMSAASERVQDGSTAGARGEDPPWTRATVAAINRDYDALARYFPELNDLDHVVRLLSLFTWLRSAEARGLPVPELADLLALELPLLSTPKTFPQLLTFNALPQAEDGGAVEVVDRVPVVDALERLNPGTGRPLSARRRYERALAALDPRDSQHRAFLDQSAGRDPATTGEVELDLLAHRAERLRMHKIVMLTLDDAVRDLLTTRQRQGERLRAFSVGIGGLDLSMAQVLDRASGHSLNLRAAGLTPVFASEAGPRSDLPTSGGGRASATPAASGPRAAWRAEVAGLPETRLPDHGLAAKSAGPASRRFGNHAIERGPLRSADAAGRRAVWTLLSADSPDVISRKLILDRQGRVERIERAEGSRFLSYRIERSGTTLRAAPVDGPTVVGLRLEDAPFLLPEGLAVMQLHAAPGSSNGGEPALRLRLDSTLDGVPKRLETAVPRALLQRLLLGRDADLIAGQPLPGLSPLPAALGRVNTLMLLADRTRGARPWEGRGLALAGEEDPARLARALQSWWISEAGVDAPRHAAVVATDVRRSVARWSAAPRLSGTASLLLPPGGFTGRAAGLREELARSWSAGKVVSSIEQTEGAELVVLLSGEPPGLFAERLRRLAGSPAMRGRLLAAMSLSGPVRADLPESLLAEGQLAGLALSGDSIVGRRSLPDRIAAIAEAVERGRESDLRVERLGQPFLWYF